MITTVQVICLMKNRWDSVKMKNQFLSMMVGSLFVACSLLLQQEVYGTETEEHQFVRISGIHAGRNTLGFPRSNKNRVKEIDLNDMQKVKIVTENFEERETVTVFDTSGQWKILAKYLNGELTPYDAYEEFVENGELDINFGQDLLRSKILMFCRLHPGYDEYFAKELHPVFK